MLQQTRKRKGKRKREKRRGKNQKQRCVLAEQNSLLLSRMVAVEEEDEHIDNTCNLIQDCMEILQVPQNPTQTSQLTPQANSVNSTQKIRSTFPTTYAYKYQSYPPAKPATATMVTNKQHHSNSNPTTNFTIKQHHPSTSQAAIWWQVSKEEAVWRAR